MEKYLGIILILALTLFAASTFRVHSVLADYLPVSAETLPASQPIVTESSFTEKLQEETEIIPETTIYQNDPEIEAGEEKVLEEGSDGKAVRTYKITYSKDGEEYDRTLVSTETTPAVDRKILRGTKIVWKTFDTAEGQIKYWKKLHVWATSYTPHCQGCSGTGRTFLGLQAGKGIIAVDPKVINLGSKVYIPGYGKALAGDTGGAIKGNHIDLGFDDGTINGWSSRFVDIYLLD